MQVKNFIFTFSCKFPVIDVWWLFFIGQLSQVKFGGILQGASSLVVLNSYKNGRKQMKIQVVFARTDVHTNEYLVQHVGYNPALGGILTLTSPGRVLPSAALTCSAHQAQLFMVALKEEEARALTHASAGHCNV